VNGNVAFSIMLGQSIIFQRLDLGFSPALIGATASAGFLGGLLGSAVAPTALKRIGFGRLIFGTTIIFGFIEFLQPLAAVVPVELRVPLVAANFFLGGFFLLTYIVPVTTFRFLATRVGFRPAGTRLFVRGAGGGVAFRLRIWW